MKTVETRYTTEICKTQNISTGNTRFYMVICGEMVRIGKQRFDHIKDGCDGICNLYDEKTKTHTRKYTTVVNYITTPAH